MTPCDSSEIKREPEKGTKPKEEKEVFCTEKNGGPKKIIL